MQTIQASKQRESIIIREMFFGSLAVLIFSSVSTMLGSLVDSIITSRFLGGEAMAAFSIVNPIYNILMMLSGILISGTQVAYTARIGKGESERAVKIFNICLFFALGLSIFLAIISFAGAKGIVGLLGATGKDANLLPMASAYLRGFAIGFPANLLVPILSGFMQIDGDRKRGFFATGIMTITNITGDLINVFVIGGGMFGMALATSIANYVALGILLLHFVKKDSVLRISPKGLVAGDMSEIVKGGLPNAISNGSLMLQRIALNYLLLAIAGQWAVQVLGVSFSFYGFVNAVQIGIAQSVMLIAGVCSGEEDKSGLKSLQNLSVRFSLACSCVVGAVILIAAPVFVGIFMDTGSTAEVRNGAADLFRANAIGLVPAGVNFVFLMYLQGIRNKTLSRLLSFLERVVYLITLAAALGFAFGVNGVWIAFLLAEVLTLLTLLADAFRRKDSAGTLREALLFLPQHFGVPEKDIMESAVTDMEGVVTTSEEAAAFVRAHDGGKRESLLLPLFIEEMAGNIIRFGFDDGKTHQIEMKLISKDGGFTIRIKDDCRPFNPTEWLKLHRGEDPTANIGIRLVTEMADEVRYVSTMSMNYLIMRLGGANAASDKRSYDRERSQ